MGDTDLGEGEPPPIDPVRFLTEGGIPEVGAGLYCRHLRGPITAQVLHNLPGAENSPGPTWMFAMTMMATKTYPELVRQFEPTIGAQAGSAVLPSMWLYPIWVELRERATPRLAAATPRPSAELRELRSAARRLSDETLGAYLPEPRLGGLRSAALKPVATLGDGDRRWGGWVILAALCAISADNTLPRPGRERWRVPWRRAGARRAGLAYSIGYAMTVDIALGLIDNRA